jgi:hypothetical protein
MSSSLKLTFPNGLTAQAIRIQERTNLANALGTIGLQSSHPVLVVVGGASKLETADYKRIENLFNELLAPLAEELGMVVVDGGTDAGIMRLMGLARAKSGGTFPLVGVAPADKVYLPDLTSSLATQHLEPHHSHFILVPGSKWGDESPWIADLATVISGDAPSATVLINGGPVALQDVQESLNRQRPVVVIEGTGRLADRIATAIHNPQDLTEEVAFMRRQYIDLLRLFDLSEPLEQLKALLKQYFLSSQI